MKIAVLMSTYNGELYLQEQIDSIVNQKCECEIDLIVRDDGSSDNTIEILKKNEDKEKLSWYTGTNLGPAYSFLQLLIDNPGYDYYAFADQDDFWEDDKLQRAISIVSPIENNYALYCSNAKMCDDVLRPIGRNVHRTMKHYNAERAFLNLASAQGCTCVLNKKLAEMIQEKGLPKNIIMHDSFITCLCFALEGFFYADELTTMKYRMHGENVGGLNTKSQSNVFIMAWKRIKYIFQKKRPGITEQLKYISTEYYDSVEKNKMKTMSEIISSKCSLRKRIKIVLAKEICDESINLDISNRIKILLNNY